MLVWAAVNEADIGDIQVGQTATFTVDAYHGRTFSGKVSQIRLNASLQQNVVTYGVIVEVENADGKLLPYMTAKLQFEVARRRNAVLVPNQALRWQPTWVQISKICRSVLSPEVLAAPVRGRSSVGRAPALQAGGRGFESLRLHGSGTQRFTFWGWRMHRRRLRQMGHMPHASVPSGL